MDDRQITLLMLFTIFIVFLVWLMRRPDKTVAIEAKEKLIEEALKKFVEEKTAVFSVETIHHREAEFSNESLFKTLPEWVRWFVMALCLLFLVFVFYYWITT